MLHNGRMDEQRDGSDIEMWVPHIKEYFEQSATLFGMKKKRNCKPNFLIQTLIYRSNIYYSKIDQRGN